MPEIFRINEKMKIIRAIAGRSSPSLCILGHGGWLPHDGYTTVPEGSTVYFYEMHGTSIDAFKSHEIFKGNERIKPAGIVGSGGEIRDYRISNDAEDDSRRGWRRRSARSEAPGTNFGNILLARRLRNACSWRTAA